MRQDNFQFQPTWKIFLSSNHKPNIKGQDLGVWRRIKLVPWLACFETKAKDAKLLDKLRAEMPGILAWAVRGCLEWQQVGLDDPQEVVEATATYKREQDTVGQFIAEECVVADFVKVKSSVLLNAFHAFVGNKEMPRQTFKKLLNDKGFSSASDGRLYFYQGIGLKSDNFDEDEARFV